VGVDNEVPDEARHIQAIPKIDPNAPPPPEVAQELEDDAGAGESAPPPPSAPGTSAVHPDDNLVSDEAPPPVSAAVSGTGSEVSAENEANDVPRLCDGVELLGEYEGSGFKEPRYLAKRADGQMVQLTELLHFVADEIDGRRNVQQIAERVSERYGRTVTADNINTLLDNGLRADGIVVGPDGSTPNLEKPDPLLALKMRMTLIPEGAVNFLAGLLRPLFWPPVVLAVIAGLIALDVWYFGVHGIGEGLRELFYQPLIVLMIYGLLILSVAFHELGHATGCRYGGARPGKIGFGIYVVWPAFYTDVTDALRLGKGGRVRTDLGGVYFNAIFALLVGGAYLVTGFEPILVLIVIQHMLMLYQFMPFLRLDGYHVVSDLTGIPDLFGRIKPTLKSMVPGQENPKQVTELKPWARAVVTLWVLTVIPVLLYLFGMMIIGLPRVLATGYDSFMVQWDKLNEALGQDQVAQASVNGIRMAMLVLPMAGMSVTFSRVAKRIVVGAANFTRERPVARVAFGAIGVAAVAFAAYTLIPNGEYKPIQPGERWTFSDGLEAASDVATGRPGLSPDYEERLGGAGSVHTGEIPPPDPDSPDEGSQDRESDGTDPSSEDDQPTSETTEPAAEPTTEPTSEPTVEPSPT
jgi:putative peptide zinc metalloprotease protein